MHQFRAHEVLSIAVFVFQEEFAIRSGIVSKDVEVAVHLCHFLSRDLARKPKNGFSIGLVEVAQQIS